MSISNRLIFSCFLPPVEQGLKALGSVKGAGKKFQDSGSLNKLEMGLSQFGRAIYLFIYLFIFIYFF